MLAPPKAVALSVARASVYWTVAVSPLRRRRRIWNWPAWRSGVPVDGRYTKPRGQARQGVGGPGGKLVRKDTRNQGVAGGAQKGTINREESGGARWGGNR